MRHEMHRGLRSCEVGGYRPRQKAPDKPPEDSERLPAIIPQLVLGGSQTRAHTAALQGVNIFITGPGGTGKSVVLEHIIRDLRRNGREVAVTASTGIAALRIGGSTIHSFLGTNICANIEELKRAYTRGEINMSGVCYRNILGSRTLVVDEISMLSGDFLDMADYHLRDICSIDKPFGGKQVIFCGDFLQLPPVIKDHRKVESHFAFQSGAWEHARVRRMVLSENFRQTDVEFVRHLNAIRFGNLPARTKKFLDQSVGRSLPVEEPLRLFPVNRKVDALNKLKLRELPGHPMQRNATFDGDERFFKTLIRNAPVAEKLVLKEGARVMLCRNDYQAGYRNGQRGVLTGFGSRVLPGLIIELEDGDVIRAEPAAFDWRNDRGAVMATMYQYPVKLAWAVSIHKSQGMTLENVVCDISGCFEAGQVYVALSRIRTAEGLSLASPVSKRQVFAHQDCVDFYPTVRRVR